MQSCGNNIRRSYAPANTTRNKSNEFSTASPVTYVSAPTPPEVPGKELLSMFPPVISQRPPGAAEEMPIPPTSALPPQVVRLPSRVVVEEQDWHDDASMTLAIPPEKKNPSKAAPVTYVSAPTLSEFPGKECSSTFQSVISQRQHSVIEETPTPPTAVLPPQVIWLPSIAVFEEQDLTDIVS